MIERLKRIISEVGISDYLIREVQTERVELYYVRRELDTSRSVCTQDLSVCVYRSYRDGEECYRGSCDVIVYSSMSDSEIESRLREGYAAALHVRAREYPHAPAVSDVREDEQYDLLRIAEGYAGAMLSADTVEDSFINSAEIFTEHTYTRIISPFGVDVGYPSLQTSGELVVQCKGEEDAELFDYFRYEGECYDLLAQRTQQKLTQVRDRARALRDISVEGVDLVLEGECVRELLGYAMFLSSAKNIHTGYSSAKVGEVLRGIYPSLTLIPTVPYSREGIPMIERALVRDGRMLGAIGDMRFASYIGAEPTGEYTRLGAESGTASTEQLFSSPCLHVVAFSDFQFDELDGYFGGEVRLGYYYDGECVRAVTGVSVSGNFREAGRVEYSAERYSDYTYDGPRYVRIGND